MKGWYEKYNPFVFFFGGFTWDGLTLKRIDQLFDNLILLTYLILLGFFLSAIAFINAGKVRQPILLKYRKYYPLAAQFLLGGLLSAYVIFYFQSASFTKTALFLCLLVGLLLANEFFEHRLQNITLLLALYFVACFSFLIFFIPVVVKTLNLGTFLFGGFLSLTLVLGLIYLFHRNRLFPSGRGHLQAGGLVLSLFLVINLLYFLNLIPPVPLSMKSGGIYHSARFEKETGTFRLKVEKPKWYELFRRSDQTFHYAGGDTVSCFTAIFAPTTLTKKIFHHWQKYSKREGRWLTTDRLGYDIVGFRDGGYRGVTRKRNVSPGEWRVDVETKEGMLIGRIGFVVKPVLKRRPLSSILK